MGLVEKLSIQNALYGDFLEIFQNSFPSLRPLSFRMHLGNILKLCEFVKQADHLVSLPIYLEEEENSRPVLDHEVICTDKCERNDSCIGCRY